MAEAPPRHERIDDVDAAIDRNRVTARNLVVAHGVLDVAVLSVLGVVVAVVLPIGWWWGVVFGLGAGLALSAYAVRRSPAWVLAAVGARPADRTDDVARVRNLLDALSVAAGVSRPDLWVVDDPGANLMTVATDPQHATLVVTTGLSGHVDRLSLESLLAHELGHLRRHDPRVTTLAVTLAAGPVLLYGAWARRRGAHGGWAKVLLWGAPLAAAAMRSAVGRRREHLADLTAVTYTRYPPALAAALAAVSAAGPGPSDVPVATAPLWLAAPDPPTDQSRLGEMFRTHPPIDERIEALAEL